MFKSKVVKFGAVAMVVAGGIVGAATPAAAQDKDQDRVQQRDQERIFGSQLMTQQERLDYSNRMRSMKTDQERQAFRLEHHTQMQERARQTGVTLPDDPPQVPGRAMGGGMGPGGGMGAGGGMGSGGGAGGPAR